jgi:hypothetical protein
MSELPENPLDKRFNMQNKGDDNVLTIAQNHIASSNRNTLAKYMGFYGPQFANKKIRYAGNYIRLVKYVGWAVDISNPQIKDSYLWRVKRKK